MIEYPKKILLATDDTEDSAKAARVGVALAAASTLELHVVHVGHARASEVGATATHPPLPGEPSGYAERQAHKLLDEQVKQIRQDGGTVTEAHLRMGQPAQEIILLSEELGVDLLVVGSGRPHAMRRASSAATRRAAMGRVSEVLVRSAPCSVLVVRGEEFVS